MAARFVGPTCCSGAGAKHFLVERRTHADQLIRLIEGGLRKPVGNVLGCCAKQGRDCGADGSATGGPSRGRACGTTEPSSGQSSQAAASPKIIADGPCNVCGAAALNYPFKCRFLSVTESRNIFFSEEG